MWNLSNVCSNNKYTCETKDSMINNRKQPFIRLTGIRTPNVNSLEIEVRGDTIIATPAHVQKRHHTSLSSKTNKGTEY